MPFWIFDAPALAQLAGFAVFSLIAAGLALLVLAALHGRFGRRPDMLPVAPFFVSVTTVFALFLGFLAADIWAQKRSALNAVYHERSALDGIAALAAPAVLDAARVAEAAETYRRKVIEIEWGARDNRTAAPEVEAALQGLASALVDLAQTDAPAPAVGRLFSLLDAIVQARTQRLAIGVNANRVGNTSWFPVVLLAVFSYAAIAAVHLDRPGAGRLSICVFGLATTFALWFLAMHDSPYTGGVRLEPLLLETAVGSVVR
jgi:hypothetical protein